MAFACSSHCVFMVRHTSTIGMVRTCTWRLLQSNWRQNMTTTYDDGFHECARASSTHFILPTTFTFGWRQMTVCSAHGIARDSRTIFTFIESKQFCPFAYQLQSHTSLLIHRFVHINHIIRVYCFKLIGMHVAWSRRLCFVLHSLLQNVLSSVTILNSQRQKTEQLGQY